MMQVRQASLAELECIDPLRRALWPDSPIEELSAIVAAQPDYMVLMGMVENMPIAFAEISIRRDYVNGCETSPVAFLEGIYVDPAHRRAGVARALVETGVDLMQARGLREFASDALLDNTASHAFHQALGFTETERVVYFRRMAEASR